MHLVAENFTYAVLQIGGCGVHVNGEKQIPEIHLAAVFSQFKNVNLIVRVLEHDRDFGFVSCATINARSILNVAVKKKTE